MSDKYVGGVDPQTARLTNPFPEPSSVPLRTETGEVLGSNPTQSEALVNLQYLQDNYAEVQNNNYTANSAPTSSDDSSAGYDVRSWWVDNSVTPKEIYVCVDATVSNAVWVKTSLTVDELGTIVTKNITDFVQTMGNRVISGDMLDGYLRNLIPGGAGTYTVPLAGDYSDGHMLTFVIASADSAGLKTFNSSGSDNFDDGTVVDPVLEVEDGVAAEVTLISNGLDTWRL